MKSIMKPGIIFVAMLVAGGAASISAHAQGGVIGGPASGTGGKAVNSRPTGEAGGPATTGDKTAGAITGPRAHSGTAKMTRKTAKIPTTDDTSTGAGTPK
jgi:hypothetical protein